MFVGDLKLHGHFDLFLFGVNQVVPRQVQPPLTHLKGPWTTSIVQGVINPLVKLWH